MAGPVPAICVLPLIESDVETWHRGQHSGEGVDQVPAMTSVSGDSTIIVVDSSSDLMPAVYALRYEVFVIEQQVPAELERDELDEIATHLVALRGDEVVGTLRIVVS